MKSRYKEHKPQCQSVQARQLASSFSDKNGNALVSAARKGDTKSISKLVGALSKSLSKSKLDKQTGEAVATFVNYMHPQTNVTAI